MATFSLRVGKNEERLLREYAKIHNISVSELLRDAAIEKISDEIDLSLFDKAMAAMSTTFSLAEVKKELDLD
jgi:RHH-type rel operon transcriptional repressor/antitoxin RelB